MKVSCLGVAEWGNSEFPKGGIAVYGSCGVCEPGCRGVLLWVSCCVWMLQCARLGVGEAWYTAVAIYGIGIAGETQGVGVTVVTKL